METDDSVRALLADAIEYQGYDFEMVGTGREMRDTLDEDDYDIVIIDVTQSGPEDGFALARVAREQGCGVILATGDHSFTERLRGSGEYYLLKPFRLQQLTELVDKILAEIAAQCVRRKRSDGSVFAPRT
ncbi:MAG: response regulator [Alphaproteobacteria bacterium]|nr:response regulator [Alphaproteobacteria bacterium]